MPHSSLLPTRYRRRIATGLAILLAIAAAAFATGSLAEAAPPPPPPVIQLTVSNVSTPSITVPNTPGAGAPYVVKGVPFTVDFTSNLPLSTNKSTSVILTVTSGPDAGDVSATVDVPAGGTTGTFTGVVLPSEGNQVGIKVAVNDRKTTVLPGTRAFDVLKTSLSAPSSSTLTGFGGGGGPGVPCNASPTDPVCGDLQLAEPNGVLSNQLLAQGAGGSFLQVLVAVDPAVYNQANPIEVVAKCDKSLCSGKGIKSYSVLVQLTPGSPPVSSPACASKGVVDPGLKFCTDYVQSTRDNAGDVHLWVLLTEDAKIIFK